MLYVTIDVARARNGLCLYMCQYALYESCLSDKLTPHINLSLGIFFFLSVALFVCLSLSPSANLSLCVSVCATVCTVRVSTL